MSMPYKLRHIVFKVLLLLYISSQAAHVWHHLIEDTSVHLVSEEDDSLRSDFDNSCDLCQLVMEDASIQLESFEAVHFIILTDPKFPETHDYYFNTCIEQSGRDPPAFQFLFIG